MIEVALFKTKSESQLKERIKTIKEICKKWESANAAYISASEVVKDFDQIWTMCRNIELIDLPLRYHPLNDWEHVDTMEREVAPSVGDTIVLDCGDTVEVIHVSHQWDDDDLVQVMTREVPQR